MTPAGKSSRLKKGRPTIGLLIGRLGDIGYAGNVWPGIAEVAAERDANLICFVGGALNALTEFDLQRNVIYDLVSPQSVDGLVAMSGSLGQFIGTERLLQFYKRFQPLPMISIAMELEGVPGVLVDNAAGMRDAIAHLIEVHGFRRIAFLRGPSTNSEAEERYRAYREELAGHGLTFDPGLVTEGNFLSPAGAEAVRLFLDERGASFEAVASANDEMALGAMAELRRRGKRVPEDICVVGFDDLEEARYSAPPLTTIRQPLYEQGRKAAEMLLDRMAGKRVPRQVVLPTELVIRQSCGCFPPAMQSLSVGKASPAGFPAKKSSALRRKQILTEMTEAAGVSTQKADPGWAERLLDSLSATVRAKKSRNVFLLAWDEILRQVGSRGGDVMQWDRVLQVLRRQAPSFLGAEDRSAMDPLWRQAESLLGEVGRWAQVYRRMQADRRAFDFMTGISEPLMTAFDIAGLTDVVAEQLPKMGIRGCYLSLYDRTADGGEKTPTEWSRLILAYNESGRVNLEPGGRRFPSRQLVPQGILPRGKRYAIMLEPLHFRNESQLGFILFAPLQPEVGPLREAFSRQISTALKGAMLLQERRQAQETLQESERREREFQKRLRTLLEISNELSRAESVDALCRQAVELGRSRLGFDRLGIWFYSPEPGIINGSFGTDTDGKLTDERDVHLDTADLHMEILRQTRPIALLETEANLRDKGGNIIGRGSRVHAAMWNGEKVIGFVSMDNLLRKRPITHHDCELLNLFASSLGYLSSHKQAEEELREYSENLEAKVEERTRALQQAQENLVRQEKLAVLGQLAATVSHEIRNPLATIRVSTTAVEQKTRDRGLGVERSLDRIQRNITRCDTIISELLEYTRMPDLNLQTVDIDDWLNRLLDEQILPEGISLRRDLASGAHIPLDVERFRRVIINLLDNARQAMQSVPDADRAGRGLVVESKVAGDMLTMAVRDAGIGIPPEVLPHIFEPLFSTKGFGVGLGLSIVKGIVEQHGGTIEIASEVGRGTSAVVRLPMTSQGR